jgi:predicted dehydrogenase
MMVKNNMWRNSIKELKLVAAAATRINIDWINLDRVPNPGTWFTTKQLAFGGVSRDLVPHLLSIFMALDPAYSEYTQVAKVSSQRWKLEDLTKTDYGIVKSDGIYNVDDQCYLHFEKNGKTWILEAQWRNTHYDQKHIKFTMPDGDVKIFELGLCPEIAYQNMIVCAIKNQYNSEFWKMQNTQDLWIHQLIEQL